MVLHARLAIRVVGGLANRLKCTGTLPCADCPEGFLNRLGHDNNPLQSEIMRGIEFEVVWFDQDVIQCQVTCSNGPFRGATKIYVARDDLSRTAETLSGFPLNIKDCRDVQLGAFEPKMAGGGISMSFRCVDSVGHAVVLVTLRADGCNGPNEPEPVCLYIPVEAGSVDSFVTKARSIDDTKGAKAYLHMADHTVGWVQQNFPSLVTFAIPTWR
jgi:hypothetical protein